MQPSTSPFVPRFSAPEEVVPKVLVTLSSQSSELDAFMAVFSQELFEHVANCTNQILEEKSGIKVPRTDPGEIEIILGCLLTMGFNKVLKMRDYWTNEPTLGNLGAKAAITRDRFLLLASKLYFASPNKPADASKTYYMDEVVSIVKNTFLNAREESSYQSIDECMVKFRGRSSLKQFMPLKPIKRGIKPWARCDSKTGYVYDFNIYAGRGDSQGERVVRKLTSTIRGSDVAVAFDRFFTSVDLINTIPFPALGT